MLPIQGWRDFSSGSRLCENSTRYKRTLNFEGRGQAERKPVRIPRRLGARKPAGTKLVPRRHAEPLRHGSGGPTGQPKAAGLPGQGSCPKTYAARRGAACLALIGQHSGDLGNGATMAAFGESCRDSGHGFSSVFVTGFG
jgi:hypothetical protein